VNNKKNSEDLMFLENEKFNRSPFEIIYVNERNFGSTILRNFDEDDSKHFLLHDCFQSVVEKMWIESRKGYDVPLFKFYANGV
jgi:hypothetical protein